MKPYLDEFVSLTNEIVFEELLQKQNEIFMLVGGQAVNASIHPINITSQDIDIITKPGISSDTVYKWLDQVELKILKEWKLWNESKPDSIQWRVNSLQMPYRFISPRVAKVTGAFSIDRWLHVHNLPNGTTIKTISLQVLDRRIMDISDWSDFEKMNVWWEDSILKWVPCPSYQIWVHRKRFHTKTEIVRGRRYFQVRIPRSLNLMEMLHKTKYLESYFPNTLRTKQLYAVPKIFNSMERIKLLESVSHFREIEKFQTTRWARKNEKLDELKEMYKARLLELDQDHLSLYKKIEDLETSLYKKMEEVEKQKREMDKVKCITAAVKETVIVDETPSIVEKMNSTPEPRQQYVQTFSETGLRIKKRERKKKETHEITAESFSSVERKRLNNRYNNNNYEEEYEDDDEMSDSMLIYLMISSAIIVYIVYYVMFGSSFIKFSFS